jgi:ketosteroid isomerase-like protein
MSEENVELVRRGIETVNRGDVEGALAMVDVAPEFEFVPSGVLIPDLSDVQRGPEGMRRVMEVFWGEFEDAHLEVHELIDAGDHVMFCSLTVRAVEGRAVRRRVGTSGTYGPCGTTAGPFACRH